jgi:hypothetical protein
MTDVFLDVAAGKLLRIGVVHEAVGLLEFAYNDVTSSLPPHNLSRYARPDNWPNIPEP